MERRTAWARVHLALDERRDPLDDELLQEWFAQHPDELAAYARLAARIADLPAVSASTNTAPTRRVLQLAATAAACLLALVVARATRHVDVAPSVARGELRVIDYRLSVTRDSGTQRFRATRALHEPLSISNTTISPNSPARPGVQRLQHTFQTETTP